MNPNNEKRSGLGTGLIMGLAGIALGALGMFAYNEVTGEKEQDPQRMRANNLQTEGDEYVEYESFLCPISQELMKDPVITPRGISYERVSILNWLKKSRECPITKTPLEEKDLITNYALKNAIDDYFKKNPSR